MLTATLCKNKRKCEPALKTVSSLFPPITELATLLGNIISEVYPRIRSLVFSLVCFVGFNFLGLYQSSIDPNPDLGIPFLGK